MSYPVKYVSVALLVLLLVILANTDAQNHDEKIRGDTNLVLIEVLVRVKTAELVKGLTASKFEIVVDDVKRPIESFSAQEASVSFGFIFDMHPTTSERTKSVIESLRRFKAGLKLGDDIFLVAFNMRGGGADVRFYPRP